MTDFTKKELVEEVLGSDDLNSVQATVQDVTSFEVKDAAMWYDNPSQSKSLMLNTLESQGEKIQQLESDLALLKEKLTAAGPPLPEGMKPLGTSHDLLTLTTQMTPGQAVLMAQHLKDMANGMDPQPIVKGPQYPAGYGSPVVDEFLKEKIQAAINDNPAAKPIPMPAGFLQGIDYGVGVSVGKKVKVDENGNIYPEEKIDSITILPKVTSSEKLDEASKLLPGESVLPDVEDHTITALKYAMGELSKTAAPYAKAGMLQSYMDGYDTYVNNTTFKVPTHQPSFQKGLELGKQAFKEALEQLLELIDAKVQNDKKYMEGHSDGWNSALEMTDKIIKKKIAIIDKSKPHSSLSETDTMTPGQMTLMGLSHAIEGLKKK